MDPILDHMDQQLRLHGDSDYDSEVDSESRGVKNEEEIKQGPSSQYVYPHSGRLIITYTFFQSNEYHLPQTHAKRTTWASIYKYIKNME